MKKMLMVATVASMIGHFNMSNMRILQDMGYEVHVACDFTDQSVWTKERVNKFLKLLDDLNIKAVQIDFTRKLVKINKHVKAYVQLKNLIIQENYSLIHCHTPIASVIARCAAHIEKVKIIYTAHGFHFYKGAPLKNWILYYPVEKFLSKCTDVLITINKEDYKRAKKKFKSKRVKYVPGVGINTEKFNRIPQLSKELREKLNIPLSFKWLLSVGELNENKNHEAVIRGIVNLPNVYYTIAGQGVLFQYLTQLIDELGISNRVKLLGFRDDIEDLYGAADIFVFPSVREGLSAALMEAMASGKPVACSRIRGNTDLVDKHGGVLFEPDNLQSISMALEKLTNLPENKLIWMGKYNKKKIKKYDICIVDKNMRDIYESI